jgi:hypothetical protein
VPDGHAGEEVVPDLLVVGHVLRLDELAVPDLEDDGLGHVDRRAVTAGRGHVGQGHDVVVAAEVVDRGGVVGAVGPLHDVAEVLQDAVHALGDAAGRAAARDGPHHALVVEELVHGGHVAGLEGGVRAPHEVGVGVLLRGGVHGHGVLRGLGRAVWGVALV